MIAGQLVDECAKDAFWPFARPVYALIAEERSAPAWRKALATTDLFGREAVPDEPLPCLLANRAAASAIVELTFRVPGLKPLALIGYFALMHRDHDIYSSWRGPKHVLRAFSSGFSFVSIGLVNAFANARRMHSLRIRSLHAFALG